MTIHTIDWVILASYFLFAFLVGIIRRKRKGETTRSYFLASQDLPWWLLGVSMVATTFALDTPLLIAGWARDSGVAKQWEWWCFLLGGTLTAFLFSRLWRRTNVLNDAEFTELRYCGKSAAFLRGFRALYLGFVFNTFVLGGALVAVAKIGMALLGYDDLNAQVLWNVPVLDWQIHVSIRWIIAATSASVVVFYSAMSGFRGIVITDFVQFFLSMVGALLICIFALQHKAVGGLGGLVEKIEVIAPEKLNFFPDFGTAESIGEMTLWGLALLFTVRWWAVIYGGSEPGGGVYVAQRILAARNEHHALGATILFNICHFALRPLPWILAGLATLLIFPDATDGETAYVNLVTILPAGVKGIVLASFVAAFMSTVDTRLNLGAAYFVNDFYRRFCYRTAEETHYVRVSRVVTVLQIVFGFFWLWLVTDISSLFFLATGLGAGSGLVFIVRWVWWRVSAWSEVIAMGLSLALFILFRFVVFPSQKEYDSHAALILILNTSIVTASWIIVSLLQKPNQEQIKHLMSFYRQVRPPFGWKPIADRVAKEDGKPVETDPLAPALVGWISSTIMIYCAVIGLGKVLLGSPLVGSAILAGCVVSGRITILALKQMLATPSKHA